MTPSFTEMTLSGVMSEVLCLLSSIVYTFKHADIFTTPKSSISPLGYNTAVVFALKCVLVLEQIGTAFEVIATVKMSPFLIETYWSSLTV